MYDRTLASEVTARIADQMARLHASRNDLAALRPPSEIADVVVKQVVPALGASAGGFFLPAADGHSFLLVAQSGYPAEALPLLNSQSRSEPSPITEVFDTGEPLLFRESRAQLEHFPNQADLKKKAGTQATAFLPLLADNAILGVLSLGFSTPKDFESTDVDLMFAFANQAAQALHRARLYQEEKLARSRLEAVIDGVPGVVWRHGGSRTRRNSGSTT